MDITITRKNAAASGLKYYFTGKECSRGHRALRRVKFRDCVLCKRQDGENSYMRQPDKHRAKSRKSMRKRRLLADTPEKWAKFRIPLLKASAQIRGIEFNLVWQDIIPPEVCPVFGTKFVLTGPTTPETASVDRFDNHRGYVKDNVRIISRRANNLKSDATLEELRAVVRYMETPQVPFST